MYLSTEWEGRTGKYLARGNDVTDRHKLQEQEQIMQSEL